jgi:hypothetical protein
MKIKKKMTSIAIMATGSVMLLSFANRAAAALWTPAEISTVAWYDADDAGTITHTANAVTQWDDKSGNALHATTTGTNAPKYTASDSGLNNMGSIGYDPANTVIRYLDTPSMTSAQAYIVVHWQNDTFDTNRDSYLLNSATPDQKIHGKYNNFQPTIDTTIWDASSSLNGGQYYRDGSTTTTNIALPMKDGALWRVPFSSRSSTWRMLNDYGPSVDETWDQGAVGEIIFMDGTEDLATQLQIEGYLAWKWGLEGALPSDHLYKALAPGGAVAVPEPTTTALLGLGGLALILRRRK